MSDPQQFAEQQRDERAAAAVRWLFQTAPPPNVSHMRVHFTYDDGCRLSIEGANGQIVPPVADPPEPHPALNTPASGAATAAPEQKQPPQFTRSEIAGGMCCMTAIVICAQVATWATLPLVRFSGAIGAVVAAGFGFLIFSDAQNRLRK